MRKPKRLVEITGWEAKKCLTIWSKHAKLIELPQKSGDHDKQKFEKGRKKSLTNEESHDKL